MAELSIIYLHISVLETLLGSHKIENETITIVS